MAEPKPANMFSLIQRISGAGECRGSGSGDGPHDDDDDDDDDDDNEEDKLAFIAENPPLAAVLDKWWQSCLTLLDGDRNGTIERDEYVNLYKRLIFGTSRMYGKKAQLSDDIDALIEEDWQRDSGGLISMDKIRFCISIYELAEVWARGQKVKAYVTYLTELHEWVFVKFADDAPKSAKKTPRSSTKMPKTPKPKTPPPAKTVPPIKTPPRPSVTKRPSTKPTPRTEILVLPSQGIDDALAPEPVDAPSSPVVDVVADLMEPPSIPMPEPQPPTVDTPTLVKASSNSVEARIALQDRIEACQKLLQPLARVSEIAWLRCTAREADGVVSDSLITAGEITELGEHVCEKLQRAILSAETAHIQDLTVYVDDAECDVHLYIALVTELAKDAPKVNKSPPTKHVRQPKPSPAHGPTHHELCFGAHTPSFDLPSMQTYAARVAPSYIAYKTKPSVLK